MQLEFVQKCLRVWSLEPVLTWDFRDRIASKPQSYISYFLYILYICKSCREFESPSARKDQMYCNAICKCPSAWSASWNIELFKIFNKGRKNWSLKDLIRFKRQTSGISKYCKKSSITVVLYPLRQFGKPYLFNSPSFTEFIELTFTSNYRLVLVCVETHSETVRWFAVDCSHDPCSSSVNEAISYLYTAFKILKFEFNHTQKI